MGRVIAAFAQFFDGQGDPLARGWLRFLESGTNNTDKNTFYDSVYQIPNANPLQLDAEGRCPNVFGTGNYRVISFINDPEDEDSPGEQIQSFDPVTAEAAADTGGGAGSFGEWDNAEEYSLLDIVTYNTEYYRSLISGNFGNNPAIEAYAWEKVDFLRFWNETISYTQGQLIFYGYNLYLSKQAINQGNNPESSPAWWRPVASDYHNIFTKTTDYEILPTEFNSVFVLSSATIANSQFDLPAMDATTDRFRVAIYNQSTFELTINALGGSSLWIDTTGDMILEKGVFQELIYSYEIDSWMPLNNSGQALGGQTLGTVTTPIALAHFTTVDIVELSVTDIYATAIHIPNNESIFLGDSDDIALLYNSVDMRFDIDIPSTNTLAILFDSNPFWIFNAAGAILPGTSNLTSTIGNSSNDINTIFVDTIYIPDSGSAQFGAANELNIAHIAPNSYIVSNAPMILGTAIASNLNMIINSATALTLDTSLNAILYGSTFTIPATSAFLNLGDPLNLSIHHNDSHAYFDNYAGNIYFRVGGTTTALLIDSSKNVNFYGNTSIGTNEYHYLGDTNQAYIRYTSHLYIGTTNATNLYFVTNNTSRWYITSGGHFIPITVGTFDIGTATYYIRNFYVDFIDANDIGANGNRVNSVWVTNAFNSITWTPWLLSGGNLTIWTNDGNSSSITDPSDGVGLWTALNRMIIKNMAVGTGGSNHLYIIIEYNGTDYVFMGPARPSQPPSY